MKIENIDGAVKHTKLHITNIMNNNLLSFLVEICSLQKLHIDGAEFYANYIGWKGKSIGEIT